MRIFRDVVPSAAGEGQFKLRGTAGGTDFNSSCIPYGASVSHVSEVLAALDPIDDVGGVSVAREGDGSSAYSYGYTYYIGAFNSSSNLTDVAWIEVLGSGPESGCSAITTMGYWDDETNWDSGVVPGSNDEVRSSRCIPGRALSSILPSLRRLPSLMLLLLATLLGGAGAGAVP